MQTAINKKLWATAREYGVDKEQLHQIAKDELKEEHISDCSLAQLLYLIDRIRGIPAEPPTPRGMASPKQKGMIRYLAQILGWEDPKRLSGFLKKYAKTDHIDWLTKRQASSVIEGLKKLAEKQE